MVMIGDSITWYGYGKYFRCLLRDKGLPYNFIGQFTDEFGFSHEGHGGDNTYDVLYKIESIANADIYFVLIGTNDFDNIENVVLNIKKIANKLKIKNKNSIIYISTLLPSKNYEWNIKVRKINQLLLLESKICEYCYILDLGGEFSKYNWEDKMMDSWHPNCQGYEIITNLIRQFLMDHIIK